MGRIRNHRLSSLIVLSAAALTFSCSGEGSDFPEVEGWTQAGEVLTYNADNLWEYINGAAELFVEYGVQACKTVDLSSGEVTVSVDLYHMASPLGAFGVYRRESAGDDISLPGAVVAALSPPYQALLVKGSTYAKVNVFEGELTEATARELLEGLARSLSGETSLPPEFALLPRDGLMAGSEGYQPESFLGLGELTDCLYAEYTLEGEESWQGFAILPEAAPGLWTALSGEWESLDHESLSVLFKEVPYTGFVGVAQTDAGVFGVSGAADQAGLLARLEDFLR